jgi:hypothetical protein
MTDLFTSKKFLAAGIAAVVAFVASLFKLSQEQVWTIITPLLAYIGAQGFADIGKGKASLAATPTSEKPGAELLEPGK